MKLDLPEIAVMSSPRYIDNLNNLLKLLKDMDHKFWMRGEIFGSIIFIIYSLQLAYLFFQVVVQGASIYEIGKWNPDDKEETLQVFLISGTLAFAIAMFYSF